MGKCKKCGCTSFFWNPASAAQKLLSGSEHQVKYKGPEVEFGSTFKGMSSQDNKSDQVAYRNCSCGHHYNYHDA